MFMRRSKFKHVFGKPEKREMCYDNIRITKSSWDSTYCSVNPKYLAIITEAAGGGAFLVLPIEKYGRIERDAPLVAGHKASVLDIQWCPFNDDLIASASEDCTVKVWQIPDGGIPPKENLTEPIADLVAHQRRVGLVVWHPTAEHVLLSSGADNMVYIWNVATEEVLVEISFPDMILSACFNYNGSKLVCTCKDKKTRVVNPRSGDILVEGTCHQGTKPQQCVYLKDNTIFTTGFSRMSERQYALWKDTDLDEAMSIQDLDTSNGVMFPFYDADTGLIFLCGKGDSTIRYFEVTEEEPFVHFINMLTSSDPQRGIGFIPKRGLNVNHNEIARCYKLHTKGLCEVIPFTVPRKSELFQDDLYPDTASDIPALTAEDWMSGKDSTPVLMSLKDSFVTKERPHRKFTKIPKSKAASAASGDQAAPPTSVVTPPESAGHSVPAEDVGKLVVELMASGPRSSCIAELTAEVTSLKQTINKLSSRINVLEDQLLAANSASDRSTTPTNEVEISAYLDKPPPISVEEGRSDEACLNKPPISAEEACFNKPPISAEEGRSKEACFNKPPISAEEGRSEEACFNKPPISAEEGRTEEACLNKPPISAEEACLNKPPISAEEDRSEEAGLQTAVNDFLARQTSEIAYADDDEDVDAWTD